VNIHSIPQTIKRALAAAGLNSQKSPMKSVTATIERALTAAGLTQMREPGLRRTTPRFRGQVDCSRTERTGTVDPKRGVHREGRHDCFVAYSGHFHRPGTEALSAGRTLRRPADLCRPSDQQLRHERANGRSSRRHDPSPQCHKPETCRCGKCRPHRQFDQVWRCRSNREQDGVAAPRDLHEARNLSCGSGKSIARIVSGLKPEMDFAFAGA
jgi:hypothetical protein